LSFWKPNNVKPAPDLIGRLDGLFAEVGKLGREQFRTTTLIEGYSASLDELSEAWRNYLGKDKEDRDFAQRVLNELEGHVRLRLAKDLFSVADALHASIVTAADLRSEVHVKPDGRPSWLHRLLPAPAPSASERSTAFESWLEGLELVEQRLVALLEREGIQLIPAVGQPFDPRRHLAVAVRAERGVVDGTVVAEELRGYIYGDRVLRHAEVVIARTQPHTDAQERVTHGDYRRD
jgi:GrpE